MKNNLNFIPQNYDEILSSKFDYEELYSWLPIMEYSDFLMTVIAERISNLRLI